MAKAPKTEETPVHRTEPTRLPNAYAPDFQPQEAAKSKERVIKLWGRGEARKAAALAKEIGLTGDDLNEVRAACPGWDDLAA